MTSPTQVKPLIKFGESTSICLFYRYSQWQQDALEFIAKECPFLPGVWLTDFSDLEDGENLDAPSKFKVMNPHVAVERPPSVFSTAHLEATDWTDENIKKFIDVVRIAPWDDYPIMLYVDNSKYIDGRHMEIIVDKDDKTTDLHITRINNSVSSDEPIPTVE